MTHLVQLTSPLRPPASASVPAPQTGPVTDTFGRVHSDLRISVTDRCNIRCFYCMPEQGAEFTPSARLLSDGQIRRFAAAAVPLGFHKLRLTGGEPLLRPNLAGLVGTLASLPGVDDLALTTNAVQLEGAAQSLLDAGLRRLNIHLDTLDRDRFRQMTRRDDLGRVLKGIDKAVSLGFESIKLNAVAMKGLTEPDIVPLVEFARERAIQIRFIEFMPLDGQQLWSLDRVLTADQLIATLTEKFGPLTPELSVHPAAPASEYRFANGDRVGFIASVSRPFCADCNRLRLTSDGKLRYCLFAREETDIREHLQSGTVADLESAIRSVVWRKWAGHDMRQSSFIPPARPMYAIGG